MAMPAASKPTIAAFVLGALAIGGRVWDALDHSHSLETWLKTNSTSLPGQIVSQLIANGWLFVFLALLLWWHDSRTARTEPLVANAPSRAGVKMPRERKEPRINVEIRRLTIDKTTEPDDPRIAAWLVVSNDGDPAVIEDWQMFFRYAGEEQRAGKQSVFEGWALDDIPLAPYFGEGQGVWGQPEYIDRRTSIAVGSRPIEGFFYAKLHNAQGFAEKDAATVFFRYTAMRRNLKSDTVPPGNIRWGKVILRELGA